MEINDTAIALSLPYTFYFPLKNYTREALEREGTRPKLEYEQLFTI